MKKSFLLAAALLLLASGAAPAARKTAREGLQPFHDLIGSWKGTGTPNGTREEREKGFWQETISWQWQFKGEDAWLRGDVTGGKHYSRFELRYRPAEDDYELKATTLTKQTHRFTGKLASKRLTVERADEAGKKSQRLVFSLLHSNRHLYRCEARATGTSAFAQVYQVGATKKGVAFATEDKGPECVVSGGLGTMPVTYKGKTYYVCCSGCRDAFREEPEKYVKEFEAKKK